MLSLELEGVFKEVRTYVRYYSNCLIATYEFDLSNFHF